MNKSFNFTSPVKAERHGYELQTANRKFEHLQQKSNCTWRTCTWKTVWVGSPSRSSKINTEKILTINIVGWLFSWLEKAKLILESVNSSTQN